MLAIRPIGIAALLQKVPRKLQRLLVSSLRVESEQGQLDLGMSRIAWILPLFGANKYWQYDARIFPTALGEVVLVISCCGQGLLQSDGHSYITRAYP